MTYRDAKSVKYTLSIAYIIDSIDESIDFRLGVLSLQYENPCFSLLVGFHLPDAPSLHSLPSIFSWSAYMFMLLEALYDGYFIGGSVPELTVPGNVFMLVPK